MRENDLSVVHQQIAELTGGKLTHADTHLMSSDNMSLCDLRTIGGIAEMWPKDWGWWKSSAEWLAQSATSNMLRLRDTGDELRDRTILLAMVLQASSPKAGGEGR